MTHTKYTRVIPKLVRVA